MAKLHWKEDLLKESYNYNNDYELVNEIARRHHKFSLKGRNIRESTQIVEIYWFG